MRVLLKPRERAGVVGWDTKRCEWINSWKKCKWNAFYFPFCDFLFSLSHAHFLSVNTQNPQRCCLRWLLRSSRMTSVECKRSQMQVLCSIQIVINSKYMKSYRIEQTHCCCVCLWMFARILLRRINSAAHKMCAPIQLKDIYWTYKFEIKKNHNAIDNVL